MSKAKNPDGEKCERTLPFKLNDEDKARKGELAATLNKQLEAAQDRKKSEMAIHNEKISGLTKKVSAQLKMINEGIERKAVTCVAVKNFEQNKIEYWFEGMVLESIPMKAEDRQLDLKPKKGAAKKWQKSSTKQAMFPDAEENPIAQVHKLETSRRGASSAVDPK